MVLEILLNLSPNNGYKRGEFFKSLLEKGLEFVLNKRNNIVTFDLSFILLLIEINCVAEKQNRKKNAFKTRGTGYIKIILAFLTEIVAFYI